MDRRQAGHQRPDLLFQAGWVPWAQQRREQEWDILPQQPLEAAVPQRERRQLHHLQALAHKELVLAGQSQALRQRVRLQVRLAQEVWGILDERRMQAELKLERHQMKLAIRWAKLAAQQALRRHRLAYQVPQRRWASPLHMPVVAGALAPDPLAYWSFEQGCFLRRGQALPGDLQELQEPRLTASLRLQKFDLMV